MMNRSLLLISLLVLATACNRGGSIAKQGTEPPPLNDMVETPNDWSLVRPMTGRTPMASELLTRSPIAIDLNALIGKDEIHQYRQRMIPAGPLTRDGNLLVSVTPPSPGAAYLIIDETQRGIEAGWKQDGKWMVKRTPSAEIAHPASVTALLGS